ncbi:hypothetical protein GGR26_003215 [Lewinella marina]|uniref:Glycosyltransferase subfamily 4-like N-terminal domain-containing protein n=1 Tax=Neolewinella marina TaxID=438751 RepID=A0A2G0CE50_9BACT|nr:glycosyltransferase [Neolewinella marina]NJB87435.1 hypothetical protein [Neolewinella marina]PHK98256.1 hypothetical protein CGL56_11165 [Neolewinella marina]
MTHRLLFLCGSLVPGKDGVGDYTRKLAAELVAAGKGVLLVATHDKGISAVAEEQQPEGRESIPVLRIPYHTPGADRARLLQRAIEDFNPDYLSLQYVPYSFSPYGLPFAFLRQLGRLRHRGQWHIMFHELWIVHRGLLTPKATAVSALQRLAVRIAATTLRPGVVHTHIPGYQERLRRLGVAALPLPLFANILPQSTDGGPAAAHPVDIFRLGFFSQFIPERVIPFIRDLESWLTASGRRLEIRLLGGGTAKVEQPRQTLAGQFPNASLVAPGFLSPGALSRELHALDLGITPVDHHLIGKSGTVAAFLHHGVPVAAPYRTEHATPFFTPGLSAAVIETFTPEGLAGATHAARALDTHPISPAGVARRFGDDLGLTAGQDLHHSTSDSAHRRR